MYIYTHTHTHIYHSLLTMYMLPNKKTWSSSCFIMIKLACPKCYAYYLLLITLTFIALAINEYSCILAGQN